MAWDNIANRTTADANASTDINSLMENIRVLGGNGTSVPSTDIESIYDDLAGFSFTSQAGVPSSTPSSLGQVNLDTTATRFYISTGTSSSADWDRVPYNDYGVVTVTQDAGDIVVTLPQSWEGGALFIFKTSNSSEYFDDGANSSILITSYDALTDTAATYATDHLFTFATNGTIAAVNKGAANGAFPKSATTKSFTLDDSNTRYVKWMVMS